MELKIYIFLLKHVLLEISSGGILSGGILERGDIVRGDFVLGGYCPGDIVRGDIVGGDIVLIPFPGHGCMDDLTTESNFNSQATWVIYVL